MKYQWKQGAHGKGDAQAIGTEIERLDAEYDGVTPEVVLDEAKKKRSPLHDCFEWNDREAAVAYRLVQARYLLRSIEVVIEKADTEPLRIRAFHSVVTEEQGKYHTTVAKAREDEAMWSQVKANALSEIRNWQNKYRQINEFEAIFDAIESVV